jgi:hypothetical protein
MYETKKRLYEVDQRFMMQGKVVQNLKDQIRKYRGLHEV